jgi:glycosyltransferase involved in cell wall biosynthesis
MHILLVHQAFAALSEPGGTRHHELARYLAQRGHRVTIITSRVSYLTGTAEPPPRTKSLDREEAGVEILYAYTYPALHKSFFHRVLSFFSFMFSSFLLGINVRQVDLVWGTSPPIFQGFTAWALARLKRVPFLFEVRDLWPAFAIAVGVLHSPLLIHLTEWLEKFLYRRAHVVVVNSPGFIDHVKKRGARRVELVPNGADPEMFDPRADGFDFRLRHELSGKFVVLYAGAHGMSNDLGIVLEAANQLRNCSEVAIVLLGDGKEKPALQEQAAELGLENLLFVPPVPKAGMPAVLAAADACLAILKPIPLYATVYPNKVFDYMAAGRPVLLAIDGVIRQVVEEAQAGIFVQPGDPMALAEVVRWLAVHPVEARQMGLNGRDQVEKIFNREKSAQKLAALIETLA